MEYPDIDCSPPAEAEAGQVWFCPYCARKFQRVRITLEDQDFSTDAWFTDELE